MAAKVIILGAATPELNDLMIPVVPVWYCKHPSLGGDDSEPHSIRDFCEKKEVHVLTFINLEYLETTFNFLIALKILTWSSLKCQFRIGQSKITL